MATSKRGFGLLGTAVATVLLLGVSACGSGDDPGDTPSSSGGSESKMVDVGFVAVGPEGNWRAANEKNIQDTFTADAGFNLKYAPAANLDQKSQIDAFTSFVDEEVDVILLSATEATGWEDSLKRAQEAEIPVLLIDRGIEPEDPKLYSTRIAPDNVLVAESVAKWAVSALPDGGNYFILEGPAGVGVVNERNKGWDNVVGSVPAMKKVGAQTANWSTEEAKSVFETVLKANKNDIQLVFAQNDEMGLGAVQAVKEAGLVPGKDVKIATIDGTKPALEALAAGDLSFVAEYNPLFGDTALTAVKKALEGGSNEPYIIVPSAVFDSPESAKTALPERQY